MGLRFAIKRLAEFGLPVRLLAPVLGMTRRGQVLILAYHNVRPDGVPPVGDRSLHLELSLFRDHLDLLCEAFNVVSLEEVFRPARDRRPLAAITFDDAYAGAVALGIPELVARGLPATVFVTPAFLGGRSFWWDALAGPAGLAAEVRRLALEELGGDDAAIRAWAATAGQELTVAPADCLGAAEEDLERAAASPGIVLGSHTWSHCNLARLGETTLMEELERPLAWLRERFEQVIPWLSYPYGRWSPGVAQAAERAGYRAALRVNGGWYRRGQGSVYSIPRLNVAAGISGEGFSLRIAGLLRG